jgi:hypothetical protein
MALEMKKLSMIDQIEKEMPSEDHTKRNRTKCKGMVPYRTVKTSQI